MHRSGYLCSYQTTNHPVLRSVQFCRIRQLRIFKIQSIWILMAGFMCSEGFFLFVLHYRKHQVQEARLIRACQLLHTLTWFASHYLWPCSNIPFLYRFKNHTSLSGLIERERLTKFACKADSILDSGALSGWRRIPSIALSMGK